MHRVLDLARTVPTHLDKSGPVNSSGMNYSC